MPVPGFRRKKGPTVNNSLKTGKTILQITFLWNGFGGKMRRGDVYYANLNPRKGSEEGGIRPIVVVQNNVGNYFSKTIIAIPITTKKGKLPTHIKIPKGNNIEYDSTALSEQIRVLDKSRLRKYVCKLSKEKMKEIDSKLLLALGLKI